MLNRDDPTGWPTFVFRPVEETQQCPRCGATGPHSARYSPYICLKCSKNIVDTEGDVVVFGEFAARRKAKDDPAEQASWSNSSWKVPFFLDGKRVEVYEGRFGGYVVQYFEEDESTEK